LPSFAESDRGKPVDECEVGALRSLGEERETLKRVPSYEARAEVIPPLGHQGGLSVAASPWPMR